MPRLTAARMRGKAPRFQQLLRSFPPQVRGVTRALRQVVRATAPGSVEVIRPGWKAISYGLDPSMASAFCLIHPGREWVNLAFSRGTALPDPHGLLEGAGKRMRHVKVHTTSDARASGIRALVRQAVRLAVASAPARARRGSQRTTP